MAEANIVIVRAQESVVVRGIAKKLENEGCRVTLIEETVSQVTRYIPTGALFICYLSETILEDAKSLQVVSKIIDAFHEKRIRSIVIGEEKHKRDLLEAIPALSSQVFMKRPVDMEILLKAIKEVQEHAQKAGETKHLLLVDDDPAYAKIVREWLKDEYAVSVVTAGAQAITFLTQNEVDLVLLDYEMPVMDGPKVLEIIRSEPATAKMPVFFLTGIGTKESVSKVAAFNPQGYILKTTPRDELQQKLRDFFANNL